jgi:hypothetical protein
MVKKELPGFTVIKLSLTLRQPSNIAKETQSKFKEIAQTREVMTMNEWLAAEADLPPNLVEGLETKEFGREKVQSLFSLLPKAFDQFEGKHAVIIINDYMSGPNAVINEQIGKLIKCSCKDKAIYIGLDMALELLGIEEATYQCLGLQSEESKVKDWISGEKRDGHLFLSHSLIQGMESAIIVDTTGYSDVRSRVSGQYILLTPHMYLSLLPLVDYLNNKPHSCKDILKRDKRPQIDSLDIHPLLGNSKIIKVLLIFTIID